jgi:hypothetical protein
MEDDVCVINDITVCEQDEMLVTENCLQNYIHPSILNEMKRISGNPNLDNHYGLGGGGIFKRETFADIYPRFRTFVELNFDVMQSIYPTVGWTDCINSLAMMMIGKKHTISSQVYELGQWGQDHSGRNYDGVEERLKDKHSILHHYKKYY